MMRNASLLALAGFAAVAAFPAEAQSNSDKSTGSRVRDAYGSYRAAPAEAPRATGPYSHSPSHGGIVRWNTPNAEGNLGGPGAGGSSGSPGG